MITVYLDLDNVIFDFMTTYNKLIGEWESPNKDKNFSKAIYEHKIFEDLSLMPRADELIDVLTDWMDAGIIRVEILSSTGSPKSPEQQKEVVRQKRVCLRKHGFYDIEDNYTIHKGHKKLFANCKSILIDDDTKNVREFIEAGGQAILYTSDIKMADIDSVIYNMAHNITKSHSVY